MLVFGESNHAQKYCFTVHKMQDQKLHRKTNLVKHWSTRRDEEAMMIDNALHISEPLVAWGDWDNDSRGLVVKKDNKSPLLKLW